MISPEWHPSQLAGHVCQDKTVIAEAGTAAVVMSTQAAQCHFKHWMMGRWFTILHEHPERYPQFVLANQFAEFGDMLGMAHRLPFVSLVIPSREVYYLPAQLIAITALCMKCHQLTLGIQMKKRRFDEQHPSQSLQACVTAAERKQLPAFLGGVLEAMSAVFQGGMLRASPQLAKTALSRLTLGVRADVQGALTYSAQKCNRVVHTLDLTTERHELVMYYQLLWETLRQRKWAMWDALINMPDNLELIQGQVTSMVRRTIEYWAGKHAKGWHGLGKIVGCTPDSCLGAGKKYLDHLETVKAAGLKIEPSEAEKLIDLDRQPPEGGEDDGFRGLDIGEGSSSSVVRRGPASASSHMMTAAGVLFSVWLFQKLNPLRAFRGVAKSA